jgi:hypothetical protein
MAKPEYLVEFCGLIATGRVVHRDTDGEESSDVNNVTLICIGTDNGVYVDLIMKGNKGHLLGYVAVKGTATTTDSRLCEHLEVDTIRGVSLKQLLDSRV